MKFLKYILSVLRPASRTHLISEAAQFESVVIFGSVPPPIVPDSIPHRFVANCACADPADVETVLGLAAGMPGVPRPCLVLTTSDLHLDGKFAVLGYADRARQIAVISLRRLGNSSVSSIRNRLQNEMAHELGHLNGLTHCSRACVMKPVRRAAELDMRPQTSCGLCSAGAKSRIFRNVVACTILAAFIAVGNAVLSRAFPPNETPFTCWAVDGCGRQSFTAAGPRDEVSIYFQRHKLLTLVDKDGRRTLRERSLPAVQALNEIARSHQRSRVCVLRPKQGRYAVGVPERPALLEVLPDDLQGGVDAATLASNWAFALNHSLDEYEHRN